MLLEALADRDDSDPTDGGESFYSDSQCYVASDPYTGDYEWAWNLCEQRIKHARRFFDDIAREQLARIFGEPGTMGGDLAARSVPGKGTTFPLTLPRHTFGATSSGAATGAEAASGAGPASRGEGVA